MPTNLRNRSIAVVLAIAALGYVSLFAQNEEETALLPVLEETIQLYNKGDYQKAHIQAVIGTELDPWTSTWEVIASKALMLMGRYEEAYQRLEAYAEDRNYDLRTQLLLREACLRSGRELEAVRRLDTISLLINQRSRRYYYHPDELVALGEAALLFGVEPKIVLENFFKRAQNEPEPPFSAFLAAGNLALDKRDYALSSKYFRSGIERFPDNPDLWCGLAMSFSEGDWSKLFEYAEKALSINPRHVKTLVLLAENLIAAEQYEEAEERLDKALEVNPNDDVALALHASIAFIQNQHEAGESYRSKALSTWRSNPIVDYVIGRELSKKYRFEDGASAQRIALLLDPEFTPARVQLAQDLLRLGREREAWRLAHSAHETDPYNITAYNLVTLHDKMDEFETLESEHFKVMLSKKEAPVYGNRALQVLEDAYRALSLRYDMELPQKTTVEIYPNPADFETRTFGMPGNPGYLGVCFGPVFTINSPSTRQRNWEAVLYHEFCHSITLSITNNRMPRWLSEGISVYEEERANPSWGQRMTASYRDRILEGEMQSISSMSAAFLNAQSDEDLQFAYYQSYLVVEFLFREYGIGTIKRMLEALGKGLSINEAITQELAPLETLDADFMEFAVEKAEALASEFRFESPNSFVSQAAEALKPKTNYTAALNRAKELVSAESYEEAAERLEELIAKAGFLPGLENAHGLLALAYRELGRVEEERRTLEAILEQEASHLSAVTRLLEIAQESQDDAAILRWSDAWLAINPMGATPWRSLLKAAIATDRTTQAIQAAEALISLNPPDIASIHYQIAQELRKEDLAKSKRHVLKALEEAPRFQKAYELLAEISHRESQQAPQSEASVPNTLRDMLQDFEMNEQP